MPRRPPLLTCLGLASVLCLLLPAAGLAQVGTKDPKGVDVLIQSVNASGATNALKPIQDFTATGTITYFWAGEQVQGPATVKGRAPDQFRLDANLPSSPACVGCPGTRSYAVSHGTGALRNPDGAIKTLPLHNTVNVGVLTFPYLTISAALSDPATIIAYVGLVTLNGGQVQQVRVQRLFSSEADPDGTISKLCITDYFVDPPTNLVLKIADMTHPFQTLGEDMIHEVEFDNYLPVNGIHFPMFVREKTIGQTMWELSVSGISFNTGLTDFDFVIH